MTKQEQNQIIKDVWAKHLSQFKTIPEDIANTYSLWLRGIIKNASAQLNPAPEQTEQEENNV